MCIDYAITYRDTPVWTTDAKTARVRDGHLSRFLPLLAEDVATVRRDRWAQHILVDVSKEPTDPIPRIYPFCHHSDGRP